MPSKESPGPAVKDDEKYEALRREGNSKEKSARIANASAQQGSHEVSAKGGRSAPYEEWTVSQLRERAAQIGVAGRSSMNKSQLINAVRGH